MNKMSSETSIGCSLPLESVAPENARRRSRRIVRPLRRFLGGLGLAAVLMTGAASAQNLDCVCLAQQSVLFTNGCVGVIPNLCSVVSNCWFPGTFTSFTCIQNPPAGTVTTSNVFISFTLFAQPGNIPFPCGNLKYSVGFTTNRFTLLCPTNQIVPCNTTNFTFYGPAGWTNVPPCCTNTPIITGPFIVTNWPVLTATWIGQVCGVVDVCQESILFGGLPPATNCNCLNLICPSNIVIQTCLSSAAGTGFTNVFYPLPVVSNTCIGTITNLVLIPPPGSPFPLGTNAVSCSVYDNLGNSATCTFDVIVLGDTAPPVVTCGPNQTVQCGSPWAPIPPTAFDVCCSNVQIMLGFAVTNVSTGCFESIDFIWHVMDCNNNFANCTNNVTITDTTPPVIACNSNQVYQCGNTAGLPGGSGWTPTPPSATDNCCLAVTVSLFSAVTNITSPCNEIITFVWSATDCCTNTSYCTETITITDTSPPVLNCQPFRQIECGASTNWFGDYPTALDACCSTNVTFTLVNVITNIQTTCFSSYTLTWTATDCCTNTSGPCVQNLIIQDTTPPVVICATNTTIQCGTPLTFNLPTAIDDCCTNPPTIIVVNTVTNVPATCPAIITRNWLIVDCCGNSTNCSQTVTIVDNIPPVINCISNQIVQCGSAWTFTPPTATDNCCTNTSGGNSVTVSLASVVTNNIGTCNQIITALWQATDCCGNKSFCTQTISVVDTIPPVIACNSNQTYQCAQAGTPGGWTLTPPLATDACCGTNVIVSLFNAVTNGSVPCNEIITLTWQAVDCCTNTAFCTEIVTITDTNPPILICAGPKVVECGTGWTFDTPTAFDICCGTNITINILSNVTVFTSTCTNIYERYWMATDCCTNNSPVCSQRVVELDTTPPVMTCAPNTTISCGAPLIFTPPTVTDACCAPASIVVVVVSTVTNSLNVCPGIVTRTWQATDCCGNSTICSQSIAIVDTVPPVITCGPNQTVQCGTPWTFNPPTATDNCCLPSTGGTLLFSATTNNTGPCSDTITAIWKAVDCCGNTAFCTNSVTVIDTISPVITCKTNIGIVQCGSPIIPPPATDNCCSNVTVTVLSSATNIINSCRYFVTNTWLAVDCCTNTASCVETIMITDTTPPVLTCASNKTIQCNGPWSFDPPTASDACCGNNVTVTILSTITNVTGPCLTTVTRTWQATDCCTNSSTCSQVVTITDTVPPVITCAPNKTVQCGLALNFDPPTAFDACCGNNVTITVLGTVSGIGTPCSYPTTRTWQATDCCGNTATCSQTITTVDTVPPTILCGANITVSSGTPWNFTTPSASDTCCLGGVVVMSTTTNVVGACQVVHTRTWKAVDCCGLSSPLCSQSVTVTLTPPPNDPCSNPFTIVLNAPYICGSNICATPSTPPGTAFNIPPCGLSASAPDVWYTVTAACTAPMTVDTCQPCAPHPTLDTVLSAYTGACAAPPHQAAPACNDDSGPLGPCPWTLQSYVSFNATACVTYYIRVAGYIASAGDFRLNINQGPPLAPVNDLCAAATPIVPGTYAWNNCIANTDGPGVVCGLMQRDVWFRYTPNCSGTVMLNTCSSSFDTVAAVYMGNCGALSLLACNDDAGVGAGSCGPSLQSYLTFNAIAGTTYRIRLGGYNGATGCGVLNLVGPSPLAVPTCNFLPMSWRLFVVSGVGNGTPWSWSLSSPCCANLRNLNVPGVVGPSLAVASAFAASINAQCPGTASAFNSGPITYLLVGVRCGPGAPVILQVGPPFASPLNMCVVGNLNILPTTGPCSFNPDIFEVELTGRDDNNNGYDDYIDIVTGASADVNGNLIPDEIESCFGPQVTAKPESQLVEPGQNVTLGVAVSGTPPFSYQWLLNGQPIAGATSSNLTINPVTTDNLGAYSVIVSNDCGSLEGTPADIFVQPTYLPVITDANLADGWFRFMVETKIGFNYVIEYKNSLSDPTWTTLTNAPGIGAPQFIYDGEPPPQQRFYRVIQQSGPQLP